MTVSSLVVEDERVHEVLKSGFRCQRYKSSNLLRPREGKGQYGSMKYKVVLKNRNLQLNKVPKEIECAK